MRPRGRLTFRSRQAAAIAVDCLEDRRLLSVLVKATAAEDSSTLDGNQADGVAAVVISVQAPRTNRGGSDSLDGSSADGSAVSAGDSASSGSGGESSLAQADQSASTADSSRSVSSVSDSTSSDVGEAGASAARSSSTAALASRGSGVGSASAAEVTPADEAMANRGTGIGSTTTEQTPGDEPATSPVPAASAAEGLNGAVFLVGTGASANGPGADAAGAGPVAGSAGVASAQAVAVGAGAAASRPASDAHSETASQTEGLKLAAEGAEAAQVRVESNPAVATAPGGWGPGARPEVEDLGKQTDDEAGGAETPSPQYSDLLTEFLPFDRSSLENAIDRFLDRFESLGAELTGLREPASLVAPVAATALAAVATEVALRRLRARSKGTRTGAPTEDTEGDLGRFAGFPNFWSLGEA